MKAKIKTSLALALGAVITACGGGTATTSSDPNNLSGATTNNGELTSNSELISNDTLIVPENGARVLAAQCFQCHGTDGRSVNGIDSLSGESESELVEEMLEMQAEAESDDIMHKQALGYTEEQIRLIAAYIASLPGGGSSDEDDDDDDREEDKEEDKFEGEDDDD